MGSHSVIKCSRNTLQLLGTLNGGQSFRWKQVKTEKRDKWIGVFANKVWVLQQSEDSLEYDVYSLAPNVPPAKKKAKSNGDETDTLLKQYLRLDYDLSALYKEWSTNDDYFKKAAEQFYGIRILNQEIVENIFSFICSSNNNISRITSMVEKLALFYGEKICDIEGVTYYSFPKIECLAKVEVEAKLKQNGFGYRAKYIQKTAEEIMNLGGDKWITKLKDMSYDDAKTELMKLPGIGAKIADCVCLMSLNHLSAIPVDTHIYQIASKLYLPHLRNKKSVTAKMYAEIGDNFRKLYGPLAGWAHVVLFCYDLKNMQVPK